MTKICKQYWNKMRGFALIRSHKKTLMYWTSTKIKFAVCMYACICLVMKRLWRDYDKIEIKYMFLKLKWVWKGERKSFLSRIGCKTTLLFLRRIHIQDIEYGQNI